MTNGNGNGGKNGNGNGGHKPAVGKTPTQDDLLKAANEAAQGAAEAVVKAMTHAEEEDEDLPDIRALHGEGQRPAPQATPPAFEEFMARLRTTLDKAGDAVQVTENAAWVKIESRRNGHKVYVNKGKTLVTRVESTLPPSAVPGATEPGRPNGRIASWIPADPAAVERAVQVLAGSDQMIRPPQRGRGGNPPPTRGGGSQGGPGGFGGGRRRGLLN